MAELGQGPVEDERVIQGLRAIWVEAHKARVAVQWLLAIQVVFILLGVLSVVGSLVGLAVRTD